MFVHRLVKFFVNIGVCSVLNVARGEVWGSGRQSPAGEVVLVANVLGRLIVVGVVMWLLCGVWVVVLRLKLHLHTKPLVSLAAIHDDMLLLVCLAIHCEGIEGSCRSERGRSRGRRGLVVEFQTWSRGACAVADKVTLVRLLRLKEVLPGPRLLEPVGTICHLTWQMKPCVICGKGGFGAEPNSQHRGDGRSRGVRRSRGSDTVSPSLQHGVLEWNHPRESECETGRVERCPTSNLPPH